MKRLTTYIEMLFVRILFLSIVAVPTALVQAQPQLIGWLERTDGQSEAWRSNKEQLQQLGEQFDSAWEMYQYFEQEADGGDDLTWADMAKPEYEWSGIYTRTGGGLSFDPDSSGPPGSGSGFSAILTPTGTATVQEKIDQIAATGGEYDPLSSCGPPGHPRWATEPFLHEFIVTPEQTWLVNEMVNDVRRVYTDKRGHTLPDDAYATANGDTIGFWDGDMLVMHTMYLMAGQYQRGIQPDYSDQVEVVERWRKVDGIHLDADFWVFDPVNLAEPWYTRQSWIELANDDTLLRLRYWDCSENQNNDIIIRDDGTSQFSDFDFVDDDASVSNDDAVR